MPALKVVHGDSSRPGPGEGLIFDRLPISARRDDRLSDGAKIQLAAIVPKQGPWPNFVVMSDRDIMHETGQSSTSVQRHWMELEAAGWVARHRRSNLRKIFLLFDLASGKRASMQSPGTVNAITEIGECTPRILRVHSPVSGTQSLRGEKSSNEEKGRSTATSPQEVGSPSSARKIEEKDPDIATAEQLAQIESLASSEFPALRRLGETALRRHREAEARTRARRSDLPDPTTADLLTDEERAEARRVAENPESHELAVGIALMSLSQDRRAREILESGGGLPDGKNRPKAGRQPITLGRSEDPDSTNYRDCGPNNQEE